MTRAFATTPLEPRVVDHLVDLASRAPSAGKTQGWHLLALEGDAVERYWEIAMPAERRANFRWTHLFDAPLIALVFADARAYVERYGEPDKAATGLGESAEAWPTPYWTVDASMAMMTLLLAAEDLGLGALLFGVFQREREVRAEFGVPEPLQLIGAVALGHPLVTASARTSVDSARSAGAGPVVDGLSRRVDEDVPGRSPRGPGRSARRRRRRPDEIIHRNRW